ncbi:MAG: chemotaxis-specific protein-glutamate methyltransferase CheB [Bacteroidales bacterium]|nr:chemotaxis-specific protein-glutamate methyltransferase CheB [Bacteroidales bacterium]
MITVLIVEDSRVVSEYLYYILSKDPQIQVIGNVSNGKKAIEFLKDHKPDVISMDIDMPIMDGLEATQIIMSTTPVPILIVTASRNANEVATTMEALAAGALGVIEKPVGVGHPNEKKLSDELLMMIKLMAEVKVVSRKPKSGTQPRSAAAQPKATIGLQPKDKVDVHPRVPKQIPWQDHGRLNVVAIGVSSGGPQVLHQVFSKLSNSFPLPILVVQHITEGFLSGLVNWLGKTTSIPIHVAVEGDKLMPGHIYFAPDNYQMGVSKKGTTILEKCDRKNGLCPSVAHLFRSVAQEYGKSAMGIILTGMGSDGAQELKLLRDAGALTIAQDKESSLIYGMPGVAAELDAAKYILSATEISNLLYELETSNK